MNILLFLQKSDVMSFMKKMLPPRPGPPVEGPGQTPDTTLGLMHLRKLFAEFRHPTTKVTQKEQEDKLYNMLPLFCKVRRHSCLGVS